MAGRVGRPIFRKNDTFVAVRPIRLTRDKILEPGAEVSRKHFRLHHLRSMYQRRRIGPKDHPWTKQMLASSGFPSLMPKEKDLTDADANVAVVDPIVISLPETFDVLGETVELLEVVELAMIDRALDVDAWNELEDEERLEAVEAVVQMMADEGEEDETDEAQDNEDDDVDLDD